ncbi:MAG: Ig-like domain-containing protein [Verrucomicrobia bacterium]|nr:Ig-like domain-containing protein [Verrucomicrobiota bacterium]
MPASRVTPPPTRFEFPRYVPSFEGSGTPNDTAFKFIYALNGATDSNTGLVNIDINRAGVALGSGGTGARNRILFGLRSNNVAAPQADIPRDYQHGWQRHSWRFVYNLNASGFENIIIANNRVNDVHWVVDTRQDGWEAMREKDDTFEQPGYIVANTSALNTFTALEGHQALFRYTDHYGIGSRGSSGLWGALPHEQPNLFRANIQILDNFVYTTMRVGFMLSGDGLVVRGNIKRDYPNKPWWLHPNGHILVGNANTLENRGIDFAGGSILIEDNIIDVERHWLRMGPYYSVDGEGIMIQEIHGSMVDNVIIRNNITNSYIGIYKMPYTRNLVISGNTLTRRDGLTSDHAYILVEADTNNGAFPMFNVLIEDNELLYGGGRITVRGRLGGDNVVVRNNTGNGGSLQLSDYVQHSGNVGFNANIQNIASTGSIQTAPEIHLSSSAEGLIPAGTPLQIAADVSGSVPVSAVEFYANNVLIATRTEPPYHVAWTPSAGRYQLTAIARPVAPTEGNPQTAWFTVSNILRVDAANPYTYWARTQLPAGERLPHVRLFGEPVSVLERFAFDLPLEQAASLENYPSLVSASSTADGVAYRIPLVAQDKAFNSLFSGQRTCKTGQISILQTCHRA